MTCARVDLRQSLRTGWFLPCLVPLPQPRTNSTSRLRCSVEWMRDSVYQAIGPPKGAVDKVGEVAGVVHRGEEAGTDVKLIHAFPVKKYLFVSLQKNLFSTSALMKKKKNLSFDKKRKKPQL